MDDKLSYADFNDGKPFEPDPTMEELLEMARGEREAAKENRWEDGVAARVRFAKAVLGRVGPVDKMGLRALNNAAVDITLWVMSRDEHRPLDPEASSK